MSFSFIKQALSERDKAGLNRHRKVLSQRADGLVTINEKPCLNFGSNDYLGLSQHQDVLQAYVEGLAEFGASSSASPVVCGYTSVHKALEDKLCTLLNKEAVLLFNSGFAANQAICQALFSKNVSSARGKQHSQNHNHRGDNNILSDKLMHASFIEGALHCDAQMLRYKHNDIKHFQRKLESCKGNTLVATEGIFSMDGDKGNVAQLQSHLQRSEHMLLVDDAHGFGVIGETGLGVSELADIDDDKIDILMATFGKAIGTAGAFVAGSSDTIEYLINFAKHYVYSTGLSPAQALATSKSIDIMQTGGLREKLKANILRFRESCEQNALPLLQSEFTEDSAILPLIVPGAKHCVEASDALMNLGIFIPAIRTPTVAKGQERLRVTLSALHTEQDIAALIDALCIVRERQDWQQ